MSSVSQSSDGEDWESRGSAVGAWVRPDRRATSLPLLLLGGATVAGVAPEMPSSVGVGLTWLTIPLALAAIWVLLRFRATRAGVGRRSIGFGVVPALGLFLLLVIVGFLTMFVTGPFLIFGVALLVTARWQRSAFLAVWAIVIGGIGSSRVSSASLTGFPCPCGQCGNIRPSS